MILDERVIAAGRDARFSARNRELPRRGPRHAWCSCQRPAETQRKARPPGGPFFLLCRNLFCAPQWAGETRSSWKKRGARRVAWRAPGGVLACLEGGEVSGYCGVRPVRYLRAGAYLQPGSPAVVPGGWHFAPGSCGPLLLLPGPKSGSANAGAAPPTQSASAVSPTSNLRFITSPPFRRGNDLGPVPRSRGAHAPRRPSRGCEDVVKSPGPFCYVAWAWRCRDLADRRAIVMSF
jgi:hypothetical protein